MKIVELKEITVSYHNNIVLENVSLDIEEKTHGVIIGPNGAGKTTLLKTINGLSKISKGSIRVFGEELSSKNILQIRKDIGYLPQNLNLDLRFPISVYEVVMIGRITRAGIFRRPDSIDKGIAEEMMRLCGIEKLASKPVGHLSAGERQKVFIAMCLAQKPKILLLDELTTNLDLKAQKETIQLVDSIYRKENITIIFVTHILRHIPETANQVCLIKEGRLLSFGQRKDILRAGMLSELYDCRIEAIEQFTYV